MKKELEKYIPLFAEEVSKKAESIDKNNDLQWRDLTIGWALGKGLTPNDALEFATFIRYHTNLAWHTLNNLLPFEK